MDLVRVPAIHAIERSALELLPNPPGKLWILPIFCPIPGWVTAKRSKSGVTCGGGSPVFER